MGRSAQSAMRERSEWMRGDAEGWNRERGTDGSGEIGESAEREAGEGEGERESVADGRGKRGEGARMARGERGDVRSEARDGLIWGAKSR
ncbi:hypothetical protein CesoFtcFv8_024685 [Champsocephalus esox]|uniref:Uncharacterized protein n=1 Tax=Champsocephalus esox TaxID=159716 RepID=A0AAN8B7J1_9TELE|nr:hypothetical protein CesoFtcFv8_024685 [Champsocephalus esox]